MGKGSPVYSSWYTLLKFSGAKSMVIVRVSGRRRRFGKNQVLSEGEMRENSVVMKVREDFLMLAEFAGRFIFLLYFSLVVGRVDLGSLVGMLVGHSCPRRGTLATRS